MKLNTKINLLFAGLAVTAVGILALVSLYTFREFSLASAREHVRTAAEIVRVGMTETMVNGGIEKRDQFLRRLAEIQGLHSARVVRGPQVERQHGKGLASEQGVDEIEASVLREGKARYEVVEQDGETLLRGTIPYVATSTGTPNCLQCHQVEEGAVLGAVTLSVSVSQLKSKALLAVALQVGAVAAALLAALLFLRRLLQPLSNTAKEVEEAVKLALMGDFSARIARRTDDEIGHIAEEINRLVVFLQEGFVSIRDNVAQLISHASHAGSNMLTATVEMVEALVKAGHFKQAIEEDETKAQIYGRLAHVLQEDFFVSRFSLYEVDQKSRQMVPVVVDGVQDAPCRWCDPEILTRPDACRARRTGHAIDAIDSPGICHEFRPGEGNGRMQHICLPIIQSGTVGSVVQLVVDEDERELIRNLVPFIGIYLREASPVLEARRLMDTLRESTLRDPMTGLHNRRFLEEYVQTLVAGTARRKSQISVLMLDLDYFKMVNDKHGHDAGDAVLKGLARVLTRSVRASDLVIRYGGEEFMILLQDTREHSADAVAEKIRHAVEEMKIEVAGIVLNKTISIGIADFPSDSETFWQAVKYADVALYQAKETGRNRVVRFDKAMWTDEKAY